MAEQSPSKQRAEAAPAVSKTDTVIEAWFVEQIQNSPVSRSTEVYNHVRKAVDDLKERLR